MLRFAFQIQQKLVIQKKSGIPLQKVENTVSGMGIILMSLIGGIMDLKLSKQRKEPLEVESLALNATLRS